MQPDTSLAHKLAPALDPLQDSIKDMHCRVVPSAFDSHDQYLRAVPLASDWRLPSWEEHFKRFGAQTILLQLPSFWQLEPFAHFAAAAEAPLCIIEPENFPLDKAAIRYASADAVLAEAGEAAALAAYLVKEHIELPKSWLLVHAADAAEWRELAELQHTKTEAAHEVHLVPGIPLLVQCSHLAAHKTAGQTLQFHTSALFAWNQDLQQPTITTSAPLLFTLTNFALPFSLQGSGLCTCGKQIVTRV